MTFYCQICMENCAETEGRQFTGNGGCSHMFCTACLTTYVTVQINEGRIRNSCPLIGNQDCAAESTRDDIVALVTPDVLAKYDRFRVMQEDANNRDCPNCAH